MPFSDETVAQAWKKASAKCECTRAMHGHSGRCNKELVWENRGRGTGRGAWEAHHRTSVQSGGSDALSNCEILCWECHSRSL